MNVARLPDIHTIYTMTWSELSSRLREGHLTQIMLSHDMLHILNAVFKGSTNWKPLIPEVYQKDEQLLLYSDL